MSRRRGEFVHRTLIFETAFRAWSHLGGLDPLDLHNNPTTIFDALVNPINNDTRICDKLYGRTTMNNPDGSNRRHYPYEPLPRSGLAHPYVRAILTLWLGPDADNETVDKDLKTLRNWWYHRKSGESVTAIADLGTEEMKGVVEGYTRHFFILAHSLVVNDNEQPPRTLYNKLEEPPVNAPFILPGPPPNDPNTTRHSQMDHCVLDAFDARGQQVVEFIAMTHSSVPTVMSTTDTTAPLFDDTVSQMLLPPTPTDIVSQPTVGDGTTHTSSTTLLPGSSETPTGDDTDVLPVGSVTSTGDDSDVLSVALEVVSLAGRMSFISLASGHGKDFLSVASDASVARRMSVHSALSIDWENIHDFDLEADDSAHIDNLDIPFPMRRPSAADQSGSRSRRSSLSRSMAVLAGLDSKDDHIVRV